MRTIKGLTFFLSICALLACLPAHSLACDTWVALPNATKIVGTILAKNSDRTLCDSQPLFLHPRKTWPDGSIANLGRITIPQVAETFATLGSSPYWCWGYEEGINEFGVAIGNEGIWTRSLAEATKAYHRGEGPAQGPTGMDLIRLGLERGRSAAEALEVIAGLLERHGQFGSGLPCMDVAGAYDNSFIIADPGEAWILETAGTRWVARSVAQGVASISNTPSLGRSFDLAAEDLVDHAVARGWWQQDQAESFDFAKAYSDTTPQRLRQSARAQCRATRSLELLEERQGEITAAWMKQIARDRSSIPSIDLDLTASSCVAVLNKGNGTLPVFWWCPARPSLSCYVPFFVHGSRLPDIVSAAGTFGRQIVPPSQAAKDGFSKESYWWLMRDLCDLVELGLQDRLDEVRVTFDELEKKFASGLPGVIKTALDLRAAGHDVEAARVLDRYSDTCVSLVMTELQSMRTRFRSLNAIEMPKKFHPFVGRYHATIQPGVVRIKVTNSNLALQIPQQMTYELKAPDDQGRRSFVVTDQAAISFQRDARDHVTGMLLHQGGLDIEFVKDGVVPPPEIDLASADKYLGSYLSAKHETMLRVIVQNNRLALDWPGRMIFELDPPDDEGGRTFRLGNTSSLVFEQDEEGRVTALLYRRDGELDDRMPRFEAGKPGAIK